MKHAPKNVKQPGQTVCKVSTLCLMAVVIALAVLYVLTGYVPLLSSAFIVLLPALLQLVMAMTRQKEEPEPGVCEPSEEELSPRKEKKRLKRAKRAEKRRNSRLAKLLKKNRTAVRVVLMILVTVAVHSLYWYKFPAFKTVALGYFVPITLAALVVGCIALEFWCRFASEEANSFWAAALTSWR